MKNAPDSHHSTQSVHLPEGWADRQNVPAYLLKQLAPGEKLIWWDRPSVFGFAASRLLALVGAGIFLWLIVGMVMAVRSFDLQNVYKAPGELFYIVVTGVFLFAGITMLPVTLIHALRDLLNSGRAVYGLTDRRLIVALEDLTAESYDASALQRISRHGRRRGTVWFDHDGDGDGSNYRHALICVKDAARVEQLIRQTFPAQ